MWTRSAGLEWQVGLTLAQGGNTDSETFYICVDTKEIERVSNQSGEQVEVFYKKEAGLSLSGKIIPIKSIPKMYICIDGIHICFHKSCQPHFFVDKRKYF